MFSRSVTSSASALPGAAHGLDALEGFPGAVETVRQFGKGDIRAAAGQLNGRCLAEA